MFQVDAPAKVNIYLRILAQEASGYHQLETIFAAVGLFDTLTLEFHGEGLELQVSGAELGDPRRNLVFQAAELFRLRAEVEGGMRLQLEKRIPHGAGLGGGSSDAAAALRLLNHACGGPLSAEELLEIAGGLGADVPFFLSSTPLAVAWGRGDRLLPLGSPPGLPVLLALPEFEISTSWAYRNLADRRSLSGRRWIGPRLLSGLPVQSDQVPGWLASQGSGGNDFEDLVFASYPELEDIRRQMGDFGAEVARLSGSGSALFAVFSGSGELEDARRAISVLHPQVRLVSTELLSRFPSVESGEQLRASETTSPVS